MPYNNPCPRCGCGNLDAGETASDCPSCQVEIAAAARTAPDDAYSVTLPGRTPQPAA